MVILSLKLDKTWIHPIPIMFTHRAFAVNHVLLCKDERSVILLHIIKQQSLLFISLGAMGHSKTGVLSQFASGIQESKTVFVWIYLEKAAAISQIAWAMQTCFAFGCFFFFSSHIFRYCIPQPSHFTETDYLIIRVISVDTSLPPTLHTHTYTHTLPIFSLPSLLTLPLFSKQFTQSNIFHLDPNTHK